MFVKYLKKKQSYSTTFQLSKKSKIKIVFKILFVFSYILSWCSPSCYCQYSEARLSKIVNIILEDETCNWSQTWMYSKKQRHIYIYIY